MKKLISLVLLGSISLGLCSCATEKKSEDKFDEQVQVVFDNSEWLSSAEDVKYAFSDLDGNGLMEIIVCEKETSPKFYEVTPELNGIKKLSFETNCYIYDLAESSIIGTYVDPNTNVRSYLMKYDEDFEGSKLFYYYEIVLEDGHVSQYAVCSENPLGYYDSNFQKIEDGDFNIDEQISKYFEGKTLDETSTLLFDSLDGDGLHSKIKNSIDTFIGK